MTIKYRMNRILFMQWGLPFLFSPVGKIFENIFNQFMLRNSYVLWTVKTGQNWVVFP